MEDPVADSSADDTEESTAASEMTSSPKQAVTQPNGTPTNSLAEEGCKCILVCPIIYCCISSHSTSMFIVFSGRGSSEFCLP